MIDAWYHFAMIRDTTAAVVAMLVHDIDGNLVSSNVVEDWPLVNGYEMQRNDFPLQIGSEPNWNDIDPAYYSGAVDELRISTIAQIGRAHVLQSR